MNMPPSPRHWAIACVLSAALSVFANASQLSAKDPKVLLIGIDGLRVDAFESAHTPAMDALAANGTMDLQTSILSEQVTASDTISGPGWTTFLSGVWADRHGVTDNSFKGRDRDAGPHGFTLAKQVKPDLLTASFLDWTPLGEHVVADADINVIATPSAASDEYHGTDRSLGLMAATLLREQPIDFAFVYFGACDEAGHAHGFHPSVKPYTQCIEATDALIAKLVAAIAGRATIENEDWLIVVSTDHGGEGRGHGGGRDNPMINRVPMIVSGAAAERGTDVERPVATTDIMAVALQHLNIPLDPKWELAGSAQGWLKQDTP